MFFAAGEAAVPVDKQDLNKMTVKQLRQVLARRGVSCDGCIEKADFVKRVEETKDVKEKEL